jgi:hypothetical protein
VPTSKPEGSTIACLFPFLSTIGSEIVPFCPCLEAQGTKTLMDSSYAESANIPQVMREDDELSCDGEKARDRYMSENLSDNVGRHRPVSAVILIEHDQLKNDLKQTSHSLFKAQNGIKRRDIRLTNWSLVD